VRCRKALALTVGVTDESSGFVWWKLGVENGLGDLRHAWHLNQQVSKLEGKRYIQDITFPDNHRKLFTTHASWYALVSRLRSSACSSVSRKN
jgi:hypothetical protein